MAMKSMDAIVKRWDPQPTATAVPDVFHKWRDTLLAHIKDLEAKRGANHPLEKRLRNMIDFVEEQSQTVVRSRGNKLLINAGEFHWFLVRLEQRQESMKALIEPDDPFVRAIDPALRRRIKAGWDAVKWPTGYWSRVEREATL
jgi:hypothetical protein